MQVAVAGGLGSLQLLTGLLGGRSTGWKQGFPGWTG